MDPETASRSHATGSTLMVDPQMEPSMGQDRHPLESSQQQQAALLYWKNEWRDFMVALRSPSQPFNPWRWIYRLSQAGLYQFYHVSRLSRLVQFLGLGQIGWRSLIPIFAMWLTVTIVSCYFGSLRSLLRPRWCPLTEASCRWIRVHDVTVAYFGVMILWNYIYTMFASPGVYIPPFVDDSGSCSNDNLTISPYQRYTWKASESRGGFFGCNSTLDVAWERKRVARDYGDLSQLQTTSCSVCQISNRPPRCHHCHTCQRCILRYDHHCIWLNNCIGYYNYRTFLLTLFYLSTSCFYGACLLFLPFYEPLAQQVRDHGLAWLYANHTGFLDIPSPIQLIQELLTTGTVDPNVVIRMLYPIFLGVCVILGSFLAFHLIYVVNGCTTLEYKILLEQQHFEGKIVKHPYDQGWKANVSHVFGGTRGMLLAFLPIPAALPPPVLSVSDDHKMK